MGWKIQRDQRADYTCSIRIEMGMQWFSIAENQHRSRCAMSYFLCYAAHEPLFETGIAMTCHNNQISLLLRGERKNFLGRIPYSYLLLYSRYTPQVGALNKLAQVGSATHERVLNGIGGNKTSTKAI